MSIYKEFTTLFPYLQSVRKLKSYLSFDVSFPDNWRLPKKYVNEEQILEQESKIDGHRLISFVSEINEESVEETVNNVQSIIKYNLEREEKEKLFQTKVNELKTIFEKQSLIKLKTLVFDFPVDKIELVEDDEYEELGESVGEGQE